MILPAILLVGSEKKDLVLYPPMLGDCLCFLVTFARVGVSQKGDRCKFWNHCIKERKMRGHFFNVSFTFYMLDGKNHEICSSHQSHFWGVVGGICKILLHVLVYSFAKEHWHLKSYWHSLRRTSFIFNLCTENKHSHPYGVNSGRPTNHKGTA